ncbi:divalent cation tolerance protein [Friedmanniella luteola]|uniref:Divalent cation tolerance protein n=1 Tax=Friedmanniella luteola TaxID=546871 RepID=A0A1H1LCE5_9ACTN|nr:divalent-cation tolerance protein CutA [Friedmanniella luteola]SDR72271.1 divalent cation tolerance protein [Friedmanniella luteola]
MTADPEEVCEVVITAPDEAWLLNFTRQLVDARLAACGHHTAIRSIYTWAGAVHDRSETRVALHTRTSCVPAIIAITNEEHPYDVPCVISLPITRADPNYRAWILDSTTSESERAHADL